MQLCGLFKYTVRYYIILRILLVVLLTLNLILERRK